MSSDLFDFSVASNDCDLEQILELQLANRPEHLTSEEIEREGFVSARHDVELLRAMNDPFPHTIAKNKSGKVIGYALSLVRTFDANLIPCLDGVNGVVEDAKYKETSVSKLNYIVMGQVCIAKNCRGQGVFQNLYENMRTNLAPHFDCVVTAVSNKNPRSLRAHSKVGFVSVHQYSTCGEDWHLMLWSWSSD